MKDESLTDSSASSFPTHPSSFILHPLTLALFLAISLQAIAAFRSSVIAPDGATFIELSRNLREAPVAAMRAADQHPGYPALIAAGSSLLQLFGMNDSFNADLLAARLISNLAGVLCLPLIWRLARKLYNERVAAVAVLIAAVLPDMRQNAADLLSDSTHLFLYLSAACCAVEGFCTREAARRMCWFAAAGAASALAFWVRPEGLSAAAVIGLLLCCALLSRRAFNLFFAKIQNALSWKHRFKLAAPALAALSLTTILCAAPYVIAAGKLTSKKNPLAAPVAGPTQVQTNQFLQATPALAAADISAVQLAWTPEAAPAAAPPALWKKPFAALREFCAEAGMAFRFILLIPLAVGLLAYKTLRPRASGFWLLASLAACHFSLLIALHCMAGYISSRHLIPIVALAMPALAAGVVYLATRFGVPRGWAPAVRVACLTGVFLIVLAPRALRPLNQNLVPLANAAEWVRAQSFPGDRILASSGQMRFYARLPGEVIGVDCDLCFALARPGDPWSFIVLDASTEAGLDSIHLPGYSLAKTFHNPRRPGAAVVVFRPTAHVARDNRPRQ